MSNGRGVSDIDISALLHSKDAVSCLKGNGDYSSEECLKTTLNRPIWSLPIRHFPNFALT